MGRAGPHTRQSFAHQSLISGSAHLPQSLLYVRTFVEMSILPGLGMTTFSDIE
jgi:hypothetical protein